MIVIKAGGNGEMNMEEIYQDVAKLVQQGEKVVWIHGGSSETDRISRELDYSPRYVTSPSGHTSRYTDRKTLEIFTMVVAGRINKLVVERLQQLGLNAIGLSGLDGRLLEGKRKSIIRIKENGKLKILRGEYSGIIENINVHLLETLLGGGYIPVIAPVAISYEGEGLNVDGDRAAAAVGRALNAERMIIFTNVPGLLRDLEDQASVIPHIPAEEAEAYIERYARGRMKRKLLGAVEGIQGGVGQVIIADGRVKNPLTKALAGQGTVIKARNGSS